MCGATRENNELEHFYFYYYTDDMQVALEVTKLNVSKRNYNEMKIKTEEKRSGRISGSDLIFRLICG